MDTGIRIFEKFEPNSERGVIKACELCQQEFGIINREHQCKRCYRAVCADCGTTKRDVFKPKLTKRPHRLCKVCKKESDFLIQYIAVNHLKFGEDSELALKWHKKISLSGRDQLARSQRQHRKLSMEIFSELWDAYNFSVREFMGLMTYNSGQAEIHKMVESVYEELQARGLDEKMEYSGYVIVFLLCFCAPSTCADLIEYLFSLKKTVTDSKQLLQLYLKGLSIEDSEVKKLSEFFSYKLKQYMGSFSINTITAECSIHVLSRIFDKKKIEEAYMFFALAIERNCEFLIKNRNNKVQCDLMVIRNCDLESFLDKYRILVTIKTASIVSQRVPSTLPLRDRVGDKEPNTQGTQEDIELVGNFKKNKKGVHSGSDEDSFNESHKTMSIRDMDEVELISPRQTQKFRDPSKSKMNTSDMDLEKASKSFMQPSDSRCRECDYKEIKIQQLESKLREKEKEISKLSLKFNFTAQGMEDDEGPQRLGRAPAHSEAQVAKLESELREKIEQNESLFKELNRYQRENHSMKLEVEELNMNNRMLKNRVESDSYSPQKALRATEKEEELARANQMYEKKLMEKNRELEELIKKNKLLAYQVEDMQQEKGDSRVSSAPRRPTRIDIHAEELLDKMKELSQRVTQEEDEKITLNHELFDLREKNRALEAELARALEAQQAQKRAQSEASSIQQQNGAKDCSLF